MTRISNELRASVRERAARCCEYCRLPDRLQVGGFEVDHIVPASRGGTSGLDNLAYSCPHCNDRKWTHVDALDPNSGGLVSLSHPRVDHWTDHFEWSAASTMELAGKTPTGRATIACLQLNHPDLLAIRRELLKLGIDVAAHGR
jgi:hypothetical protein